MNIPIYIIDKVTALGRVIQEGKATLVDEVLMTNKFEFEALDRTLSDLIGKEHLMGGMCTYIAMWEF